MEIPDTYKILSFLSRRDEIVRIIEDHRRVSFDFLARRFPDTPLSTLHFDLARLVKQNQIMKLGTTRGVLYCPKKKVF